MLISYVAKVVVVLGCVTAGVLPQGGLHQFRELGDVQAPVVLDPSNGVRLAVGDADGDGALDVFVANDGGRSRLFLTDGRGRWRDVSICALPGSLSAIAAAFGDVDGDGDADLVVAARGQNRVLINDGTGCFDDETASRLPIESLPASDVVLFDSDGDGDRDCVFAQSNGVGLYRNDGTGRFLEVVGLGGPSHPSTRLYAADIEGDQDLDLIGVAPDGSRLLVNAGGLFADATAARTGWDPALGGVSAAVRDVDGDGKRDVVLVYANEVRLWSNDGTGRFLQSAVLTDLAGTRQVVAVDLDLDGLPELVGSNGGGGVLMENDGAGVFRRAVGRGIPSLDAESVVSDLDLDGDPDLVTAAAQLRTLYNLHHQAHIGEPVAVGKPFTLHAYATPGYAVPAPAALGLLAMRDQRPAIALPPFGRIEVDLGDVFVLPPAIVDAAPGRAEWTLSMPNLPGLVDHTLFAQGFVQHAIASASWRLTNTVGKSVRPNRRRTAVDFLTPYGLHNFTQQYTGALQALLEAEQLYEERDYAGAQTVLAGLWASYPVGSPSWGGLPRKPFGINLGTPPCYYALRMLTDMTEWRVASGVRGNSACRSARLTVLLVGESAGIEPRDWEELQSGGGIPVVHALDARVTDNDHRAVHQSLRLFKEYFLAATGGGLGVETRIVELPGLRVPVVARATPRFAGLDSGAFAQIWAAVPQATKTETDWWWIVYPSHVPEQYPDFATTEFITGGMGTGPDSPAPAFIIDDRWLVRKPPHLGAGVYSDVERRAYLPQWLQHEFFHHLFRTFPEFGLEETPHQWFDRSTWPPDFVGIYETDYFHEALFKRLMGASPPLHVRLRYATAGAPFGQLTIDDVLGTYTRHPVQNPWHVGTITRVSGTQLRWTNTAGVRWNLTPDLANGRLLTGPDCPYFDLPNGKAHNIALRRNGKGDLTDEVDGFSFLGELYAR